MVAACCAPRRSPCAGIADLARMRGECLAGVVGAVVAFALLLLGGDAAAQERRAVQAGTSITIVTTAEAITNQAVAPPEQGRLAIVTAPAGVPPTSALVYFAPPGPLQSDLQVLVSYAVGGRPSTVQLVVTSHPPGPWAADIYDASFKALFILFVLATILESGLAVIFNWRVFLELFDARGVRTIVSIVFAWLFVQAFDLDITTKLVNVYVPASYPTGFAGKLITALVLAGGSAGVNRLLVALGFRAVRTPEEIAPKLPPNQAWVGVRLIRDRAKGPVDVLISDVTTANATLAVAGTIAGSSRPRSLLRYFLRDPGRFPTAGGYAVQVGKAYEIRLAGIDKEQLDDQGKPKRIESSAWGPYTIAPGAIVDIELKL